MVFKIIHEHTVLRLITINACKNCFHNKLKGKKTSKKKIKYWTNILTEYRQIMLMARYEFMISGLTFGAWLLLYMHIAVAFYTCSII